MDIKKQRIRQRAYIIEAPFCTRLLSLRDTRFPQGVAGELLFCPYFLGISLPATILR